MKKFLLVCLAAVLVGCTGEPRYDGMPARYWLQQLKSKDPQMRALAAYFARKMGRRAKSAIPDLIELLDDPKAVVRHEAVMTLGSFGPDARAAVPALTKLLNDSSETVREATEIALDQIDPGARARATAEKRG